jgi:hypothetical protein
MVHWTLGARRGESPFDLSLELQSTYKMLMGYVSKSMKPMYIQVRYAMATLQSSVGGETNLP